MSDSADLIQPRRQRSVFLKLAPAQPHAAQQLMPHTPVFDREELGEQPLGVGKSARLQRGQGALKNLICGMRLHMKSIQAP